MPEYTLLVGTQRLVDGIRAGQTKEVSITGEQLAERTVTVAADGSRGYTEQLYYTDDMRLLVHIRDWSLEPAHRIIFTLTEISRRDLQPGGSFADLGQAAWAWLRH